MKGILTNCVTEKVSDVEVSYEITYNENNQPVFELRGGPTGYEGFRIDEKTISQMVENGWTACMGTKNRWDKLVIPADEMRKAFENVLAAEKVRNAWKNLKTEEIKQAIKELEEKKKEKPIRLGDIAKDIPVIAELKSELAKRE